MPTPQYFEQLEQLASQSCTLDTTPPTFSGIASATANIDGSITMTWALATSTKPPVDYHIYIASGSVNAATLFQDSNVAIHIPPGKTMGRVFMMPDEATYLVKDQQYTVGVRANDSQDYEDSNTAIQLETAIASGNLPEILQDIADQAAINNADLEDSIEALDLVTSRAGSAAGLVAVFEDTDELTAIIENNEELMGL